MKKILRNLTLASLAALLLLMVTACNGQQKTADLDVKAVMADMLEQYPIQDGMELSESDLLNFYGIQAEQVDDFAASLAADGITANEIVLVKAKDEDSAAEVETKLQNRLDARRNELNGYLPDQYEIVEKSEVKRDGVYVRLIISPQQDALVELYNSYLNG